MIKIDVNKITEWEEIKKKHEKKFIMKIKDTIYELKQKNGYKDLYVEELIDDNSFLRDLFIGDRNKMLASLNIIYKKYGISEITEKILIEFLQSSAYGKNIIKIFKKKDKESILIHKNKKINNKIHKKYKGFIRNYYDFCKKNIYETDKTIEKDIKKEFIRKYYFSYSRYFDELEYVKIIFDYEKNIDSKYRHELLSKMNITVCPYCNRQYITHYNKDGKIKTTADLDHFYPKSVYIWLSLSLYNFIPSCAICNSRMKGSINFKLISHIYPYEESFESEGANFKIEYQCIAKKKINILKILNPEDEFTIKLDNSRKSVKVQNSLETFNIEEVYQIHRSYVTDILRKKQIYNKDRIKELVTNFPEMFNSEQDVEKFIYGMDLNKISDINTPLSKLTKDIIKSK